MTEYSVERLTVPRTDPYFQCSRRFPFPPFPPVDGRGIDAEFRGQLPARVTQSMPGHAEPRTEGHGRCIGTKAEELVDPRDEEYLGFAVPEFPMTNAVYVDSHLFGNLTLEQPEIESAHAEVVAEGFQLFWTGRIFCFSGGYGRVSTRQRRYADQDRRSA